MNRKTCARCGRKVKTEEAFRSNYSKAYYCADATRCAKRAGRQKSERWYGHNPPAAIPPH